MPAVQTETKIAQGTTLVGKYKVTREIGRGGMAAVYEAEHMSLGKRIAVKVLAQELSASTVVIERFFREARAAASVKSPHIVDVYDSGRLEDGRPFIAMELLEGESLYDRMARVRLIDPGTTVRVIAHCAKGLMKAHAAGVIHRDLKPENIFIVRGEEGEEIAKLLDFGLAKFYAPVAPDEKTNRLTREGAVFGTPAYMSPEQVKGQGNVDHRADLWALGCMAFECVIGRPVWNTDQGVAMTFAAIATAPVPVPSKIRPDLPASFDAWFAKALERDPNRRFQSAKELADSLAQAFGNSRISLVGTTSDPGGVPPAEGSNRLLDPYPSHPSGEVRMSASRPFGPSGVDVPLTADTLIPQFRTSPVRFIGSALFVIIGLSAGFTVWSKYLQPQVFTPTVMSSATIAPTAPTGTGGDSQGTSEEPKWVPAIVEAQKLFAAGNVGEAQKKLRDSIDGPQGSGAVGRAFSAQIDAASRGTGPCKLVAIGHPRFGIGGNANRPSVVIGAKGALVAWNDDHEQAGRDHAYSVLIDPMGRALSRPRDITPEAIDVERPLLLSVGERTALLYWDKKGNEAGVRVRWLDANGRIGGASILIGAGREGSFWPVMDRAPDGFWVAWQDARDKEGDDVFLRHLSPELEPTGPEIRATDFAPAAKRRPVSVWLPSIAVASNAIFVAYRVDREGQHGIERIRVPLSSSELTKGLSERAANEPLKKDRVIGNVQSVGEDKILADAPTIACGTEGCFLAWQGESGGAFAAMIDTAQGRVVWHKKFSPSGLKPALGASSEGQVGVAWFDGQRVKMAMLSRDGVGTASLLGSVHGDHEWPRPSLAGAKKGEWYVAWQDVEANHTEIFAGRVSCR